MMGMNWFVKGIYDCCDLKETLIEFIERVVIDYYEDKDWGFYRKSIQEVLEMDPTLDVEGDLVSIHQPKSDTWRFPMGKDAHFGVQTKISEKLAWINIQIKGTIPPWRAADYDEIPDF